MLVLGMREIGQEVSFVFSLATANLESAVNCANVLLFVFLVKRLFCVQVLIRNTV